MAINIKPENKGKLHAKLGVPEGDKIPAAKLAKAKKSSSPAERKEATFAENARKWDPAKKPKDVKSDRGTFGMK
jgi:hypothetical protein